MEYNIYCDESCHLEHDDNSVFVLGGIICKASAAHSVNADIIALKKKFNYNPKSEMKWTKISPCNVDFYLAIVDYFFDNLSILNFRGYVGRGKNELSHDEFNQTYDDWYYKMYYRMLEFLLNNNRSGLFNIYIDKKDTLGSKKIIKLEKYFNAHYSAKVVNKIQLVESDHIAILQMADIFIGALSYSHRNLSSSSAKLKIIQRIQERSNQNLLLTSSYSNKAVNWFIWVPSTWR